jgi:RNA polymerase sigma-70 factor (ECF subfamily)
LSPQSVGDSTALVADRDQLERGFRRITAEQRAILVLHYYVGMSMPAVAEALNLPVGTAQSRLARALVVMRVALGTDAELGNALRKGELA